MTYLGAFLGGIATAFGQGWAKDYFKRKEELRGKLDRPFHLLSDVIAVGASSGYSLQPKQFLVDRGFKVASRLESLGNGNIANNLREFLNKWNSYSELMHSIRKGGRTDNIENIKRSIETRERLNELSDLLLGEIASEYKLIPKLKINMSYKFFKKWENLKML